MPEFVPTFWNTLTQHNVGSRTSKVATGQVAYKKKGYAWDHVDASVQGDFTVEAFPGSVQFPKNAQDWVDISFNGEYSAKCQVVNGDWCNSEDALGLRFRSDASTNSIGIISPDKPWQVVYYDAFGPGCNLIYGIWKGKTTRFEHVIEITEMPPGDSEFLEYNFYVESKDATTFVGANHDSRPWAGNSGDAASVEGFSVFLAKGDDPATPRGAVLRTPVCWWSNLDGTYTKKNVRVDVEIQPDMSTVKATKYVKRSDIQEALSQGDAYRADVTFNPDASPETTTFDGLTLLANNSLSWSGLIGTANGQFLYESDATTEFRVWAKNTTNNWDVLARAHFLFDTSSIGGGQQVDTASIDLSVDKVYFDEFDFYAKFYATNPASNTGIAAADHDTVGTTAFSDSIKITDMSTDWTTETWTLTSDGREAVDMEGISKFGLAVNYDRENGTTGDPTWVINDRSGFSIRFADNGSNIPVLTVTHSAAGPVMPILIRHYDNMRAR